MKNYIKGLSLASLLVYATHAHAACDELRAKYNEAVSWCNTAADVTHACEGITSITNAFTFGLSGLYCAFPAVGAQFACDLKSSRLNALNACENSASKNVMTAAWRAEKSREREMQVRNRLDPEIKMYQDTLVSAAWSLELCLTGAVKLTMEEGIDPESEEGGIEIAKKQDTCNQQSKKFVHGIEQRYRNIMWNYKDEAPKLGYPMPPPPIFCIIRRNNKPVWNAKECEPQKNTPYPLWYGD